MINFTSKKYMMIIKEHWENILYEIIAEKEIGDNYWTVFVRDRDRNDENNSWVMENCLDENYERLKYESAELDDLIKNKERK